MLQRTTKLLIGKDINNNGDTAAGDSIADLVGDISAGELIVLDKNKEVLAAGSTIADTDVIYIAQGTGTTYDYSDPQGTAVTGVRKIRFSDPIEGVKVKSYKAKSYTAKSEQTDTWDLTGLSVTAGVEYLVRIVYKDVPEHPGQFVQTYRHVAPSGASLDTVGEALEAEINKHSGRRVNASYSTGSDELVLTAREIPNGTTSLTDIDEFKMVEFESFLNYVDSDGHWQTWADAETYLVRSEADYGSGNWEQIRDLEKSILGYRGVMNKTHFPIVTPDMDTVKDSDYHMIVIEHDRSYVSPDNQYVKQAPLTTIIACPVPSSGTQLDSLLAQLNPWMASLPGEFKNVSF